MRAVANGGYPKGELTRQRILDAELKAFGEASYLTVTTRQISEAADVSLPTLQYYFGSKEGLYCACAKAIVERYRRHTAADAAQAAKALTEGCPAEEARVHLKAVIGALARLLVGSDEAQHWAQFVSRELRDPGPAFEILYERLWRPGGELTAALMGRITGRAAHDPEVRLKAQILISALLAFQAGRKQLTLRALGWSKIGEGELALILSVLNAQIDAIATADNGLSRLYTDERTSTVAMPRGNQP